MRLSMLLVIFTCIGCSLGLASPGQRELRGEATFRYLGIPVYNARLFTPGAQAVDWRQEFSLELTYLRALSQADLIESTISEMQRMGNPAPSDAVLGQCFRDVRRGDRFMAVTQGADQIRFFFNGAPVCTLSYPGIKLGFMSIFLGENTRSARFTRLLKGE